jgi:hypothetical protein
MWAVADYLAIGAKHGLLQANRVHIRFVRPVIHDTPPLVVQFKFRLEESPECPVPFLVLSHNVQIHLRHEDGSGNFDSQNIWAVSYCFYTVPTYALADNCNALHKGNRKLIADWHRTAPKISPLPPKDALN